jgi:2-oxoisovalerate dehydrogenase E1 component
MDFNKKEYSNDCLLNLYKNLLWPRMIEEKMLVLLRQGKISKWFSGIGQEAISVGATIAMQPTDWMMPLHRNLGVFTGRKMPLHKLFKQWQGAQDGYSKGRERSFHFGTKEHYICGMISHLGPQLAIADGVALAYKLKNKNQVSIAFTGDGGTSEGDFHEALNVAAVWDLPVIFIIENNGYGLSTPVNEQYKCESLIDRAKGYGIEGIKIDGNNILEVYDTILGVREYCIKNKKPYIIECMTFRMRGHEEASGVKYVPTHLFDTWQAKDPISNYEKYLLGEGVLDEVTIANIKNEFKQKIESELAIGFESKEIIVDTNTELADVFQNYNSLNTVLESNANQQTQNLKFFEAIQNALWQSMEQHSNLVLMGQDIAEYGGAFKITAGFVEQFGKERVRNTPLCESAIIGTALGLSLEGFKAMVEMQFADFVSVGLNQIVNNLAKIHYRWGQTADVVIRMPTGAGVGAGPFHSQSNEAWFTKVPGLKVVYPSNAFDAKGLLIAAINDPNPVLFFEHKALYRSKSGDVPTNTYELPIGKAKVIEEGTDLAIITYGMGVHWALEAASFYKNELSIEILDLRSLAPLDYDAIKNVVAKTGKVIVLTEDNLTGSIASEIAAWISENCFEFLDAPVLRCGSLETPIPFNIELEKNYLANARLQQTINKLIQY